MRREISQGNKNNNNNAERLKNNKSPSSCGIRRLGAAFTLLKESLLHLHHSCLHRKKKKKRKTQNFGKKKSCCESSFKNKSELIAFPNKTQESDSTNDCLLNVIDKKGKSRGVVKNKKPIQLLQNAFHKLTNMMAAGFASRWRNPLVLDLNACQQRSVKLCKLIWIIHTCWCGYSAMAAVMRAKMSRCHENNKY